MHRIGFVFIALLLSVFHFVVSAQTSSFSQDNNRAFAESAIAHGDQLMQQWTGDARRVAIEKYEGSLPFIQATGDRLWEARVLQQIGSVWHMVDEYEESINYRKQAVQIYRALDNHQEEVDLLTNIGVVYGSLGEYKIALDYHKEALELNREIDNRDLEAIIRSNMGLIYNYLGENQNALDHCMQALTIFQSRRNGFWEGIALLRIGKIYDDMGDGQRALEYYRAMLQIFVGASDIRALGLSQVGKLYADMHEYQTAVDHLNQALQILQVVGKREWEATTLTTLAGVYNSSGDKQKALDYLKQALKINRSVKDRAAEGNTLRSLMTYWRALDRPGLAILYGKKAVNTWQEIRANIKGLEAESQRSYFKSKESTYAELADLLLSEGRTDEAQQILDILKEAQNFISKRRDSKAVISQPQFKGAALKPAEAEFDHRYQAMAERVMVLDRERVTLLAKQKRTVEQEKRVSTLSGELIAANQDFQKFLDQVPEALGGPKLIKGREVKR